MHYKGVYLNVMKGLGYCIARRFEHRVFHQRFDAYSPNRTLEVFGSRIVSFNGTVPT